MRCSVCEENVNVSSIGCVEPIHHLLNLTNQSKRQGHFDKSQKLKKIQGRQRDIFHCIKPKECTGVIKERISL